LVNIPALDTSSAVGSLPDRILTGGAQGQPRYQAGGAR